MKNVLLIIIDELSKWYIDKLKTKGGIFDYLENNSYCCEAMYSGGPFTQSAYHYLMAGEESLIPGERIAQMEFSGETMIEAFSKAGYTLYRGKYLPLFGDNIKWDNYENDGYLSLIAAGDMWRSRIIEYVRRYQCGKHSDKDFWKLERMFEVFFRNSNGHESTINAENKAFHTNRRAYIENILKEGEKSSFYKNCVRDEIGIYEKFVQSRETNMALSFEELLLARKVKYGNLNFVLKKNNSDHRQRILNGNETNQTLFLNEDVYSIAIEKSAQRKRLREELDDFLYWYNNRECDEPFFAVIHNYDFHYPENIIDRRRDDKNYIAQVKHCTKLVADMMCPDISITAQLAFKHIEDALDRFIAPKNKRLFEDCNIYITADHGRTRQMILGLDNEWHYTRRNFQIPFYAYGTDIRKINDLTIHDQYYAHDLILDNAGISYSTDKRYSWHDKYHNETTYAYWINGSPDLDYKPIMLGIRNNFYSITYRNYITSFFDSGSVLGIYDLCNDPNEENNLILNRPICSEYSCLERILKDLWMDLVISTLTADSPYDFSGRYSFLNDTGYWNSKNRKISTKTWADVEKEAYNKKIILFGAGDGCSRLLNDSHFRLAVDEIWDNAPKTEVKYGIKICKPRHLKNAESYVFITGRYDIEMVYQLENMGLYNYVIYNAIR